VPARNVRAAIRDYIAETPGISRAFKDEPHYVSNEAWYTEDGIHGTVAFVHLDSESESRLVINGFPDAGQQVTYFVGLVILYEYLIPDDEQSPDEWVDGLDDIIDNLKARIRADPHMGTGPDGVIWSAAQHDGALSISRDLPRRDGGFVRSWNVLQFRVTENV
jgi:hypothetical protein